MTDDYEFTEEIYWRFDSARNRSGQERWEFKKALRDYAAAPRRLFTPVEEELRDLTTALLKRLDTSATAGVIHWPEIPALKKLLGVE